MAVDLDVKHLRERGAKAGRRAVGIAPLAVLALALGAVAPGGILPWLSGAAAADGATSAVPLDEIVNCADAPAGVRCFTVTSTLANDTGKTPGDANPGDGKCATAATGVCTLRAAIEEGNATLKGIDVLITAGVTGTIQFPSDDRFSTVWMESNSEAALEYATFLRVGRTMTINLDKRLGLQPKNGSQSLAPTAATGLAVDAPGVQLRNFSNWFATGSAILFTENSDGSTLKGGVSIQTANNHTMRLIGILPEADNLTIEDMTLGRVRAEETSAAIMIARNAVYGGTVSGLTISGVKFKNGAESATCSGSDGRGCDGHGILGNGSVKINNFTITGCFFNDFTGTGAYTDPVHLNAVGTSSNWTITGNYFENIRTGTVSNSPTRAALVLPAANLLGTNVISGNTFDNGATGFANEFGVAIAWDSNQTGTTASNLVIERNHFDGYNLASIRLYQTGTVTVRRNTFGTKTTSQSSTELEETATSGVMVANVDATANRKILTWSPVGTVTIDNCQLSIPVAAPTGTSNKPTLPVTLDFYWTNGTTAEQYLTSVENVVAEGSVTLPGVVPPQGGYIRVQTQGSGSRPESSQYSKRIDNVKQFDCQPRMDIDLRAWTDVPADATSHDAILAAGAAQRATELPSPAHIAAGTTVWFTYTVRNTGNVALTGVVVRDILHGPEDVCRLELVPAGEAAGCARQHFV
ncbi:MAG: right-handed parallel beta-helix repeat-containing protein [Bifidobacteriaceae bacterium]|jgi:hypothetical protein|nr:right-handed parallel beta-helix repeat-containing protein [Bifidobacteriaceae bacterium]